MKTFTHFNASTVEEAVSLLERYQGKAALIAGGTDLLGKMKDRILPDYPEALVNLKTVPGLDIICEDQTGLTLGPLAILEDIAHREVVKDRYTALAEAARRTASPHLREMGTIAGNICQDIRCWYYRHPENRFPCLRKRGWAVLRAERGHPVPLHIRRQRGGRMHRRSSQRYGPGPHRPECPDQDIQKNPCAEDFFQVEVSRTTVLEPNEIVTAIQIPKPDKGTKSAFFKFALRKSIDFPIVNCAAKISTKGGKVD
jgi:xanthine dehydrogenase YagS FAD-binding subunit